jgi:hypothetical protein
MHVTLLQHAPGLQPWSIAQQMPCWQVPPQQVDPGAHGGLLPQLPVQVPLTQV